MLALRLFLPESWTSNRARLDRAGVPAEYRTAGTKPELALVEIDRAIAAGVRFGCVLADAGYGLSAPFRQGLILGRPNHWLRIHVVDGSVLPSVPATTFALVQMANADRIATAADFSG
jgi:hypothetical protein